MLKFILEKLVGKKTLLSLFVLLAHQALKAFDMDVIPDEQLSQFIDTGLIILAGVFKFVGNNREAKLKQDMEAMQRANKSLIEQEIDKITKPSD